MNNIDLFPELPLKKVLQIMLVVANVYFVLLF
ncbi:MAG: hypothetical protein JWR19_576 [Pedosphaera sp.]|nr:hypothetical protein [Pedosphaera sp.]